MRLIGLSLIVLGIVALVYGGISYRRNKTVLDIGDMQATITQQENIPISPIVGVLALIGGVAIILVDKRRP